MHRQDVSCVIGFSSGAGSQLRAWQHHSSGLTLASSILRLATAIRQRLATTQLQRVAARAAQPPLLAARTARHPLQSTRALWIVNVSVDAV